MSFDVNIILRYYPELLGGAWVAVWITAVSLVCSSAVGAVVCIGRLQKHGAASRLATAYIDLFRATPEIVLIIWVFYCLPLLFDVRIGRYGCAIIALSAYGGAYMAEIFRAGVQAVPRGQIEAANALGIPIFHIVRRVIVPPAIGWMMPALVNFLTELLKATSLLALIGVAELIFVASTLGSKTFAYMEFYTAIAVIYFMIIFPLSVYARRAEQRRLRRTGN
ncbi:MAG: amino acid ABC transporter permease [Proteobacteria bacterium]|nr:amino acid ABC transporter permease [Pseudomonadota bacterium]